MRLKCLLIVAVFVFPLFYISTNTQVIQSKFAMNDDVERVVLPEYRQVSESYSIEYILHPAIEIISDQNFTDYGFNGEGTINDPFIIENYNITTSSSRAIIIESTTKYFVIRNCLLKAASSGIHIENIGFANGLIENNSCSFSNVVGIWGGNSHGVKIINNICFDNDRSAGIHLKECSNATIVGNICEKNSGGIILEGCLNSEVRENLAIQNGHASGIKLSYSNGTRVENNTCINNSVAGIQSHSSNDAIIEHNTVFNDNGYVGIAVTDSISAKVLNNTVTSNYKSMSFHRSPFTEVISNKLYVTGLDIRETYDEANYLLYTFEDNTVNDLILGYFKEPVNIKLTEPIYGQIFIVFGNDITIQNHNSEIGFIGITLRNCNDILMENLKIVNTPKVSVAWSIWIYDSEEIEINNVICKNRYGGINLHNTNYSTIKSTLCEGGSSSGIWLYSSNNNRLINNTCINNARYETWSNFPEAF